MAHGPIYRVPFRRRREGRTDYRNRLALLKSRTIRVVVRTTTNNTVVQFVEYDRTGDRVRAQATATELRAMGWAGTGKSTPAAYLTGLLAGGRAKAAGVESGVLDIGRRPPTPGGRVFAALKGVLEGGIEVPHGASVIPGEDRLHGKHLGEDVPTAVDQIKAKIQAAVN